MNFNTQVIKLFRMGNESSSKKKADSKRNLQSTSSVESKSSEDGNGRPHRNSSLPKATLADFMLIKTVGKGSFVS